MCGGGLDLNVIFFNKNIFYIMIMSLKYLDIAIQLAYSYIDVSNYHI